MKTQLEELLIELQHLKPKTHRFNKRYEYTPYEYDKNIHIIDVNSIKGSVSNREDLLLSNFWALFLGLLRDVDVGAVIDTGGGSRILRTTGDVNYGVAYLVYGTGTTPESFTDYVLASYSGSFSATIARGIIENKSVVTLSGTLPAAAREIGIQQVLHDTSGADRTILLARTTGSWSAGSGIVYSIDFLSPWVYNVTGLMCGILRNANEALTRIDGIAITARTSTEVNAGATYMVISSSRVTWSPTLYSVPSPISLTTYYGDILGVRTVRYTALVGSLAPSDNIEVNSIALYQPIYDTTGATHTVCWLVLSLESPIIFYANRNNIIVLRILAF